MVPPYVKQTWAVLGVLINMLGQGMVLSYPSSLIHALQSPDSDIPIDIHMSSWIASCIGIAGFPGFFISGLLMDLKGRKMAHAIVMIPGTIGWLLIYFATDIRTIIIGRLLGGFTASATVCLGAVVIGEFSSPSNRGMFLNMKTVAVCLGNTVIHILGYFLHWRTIALLGVVPHAVALTIIITWPESPAWLASKKRFEESEKSFLWLRGNSESSRREFDELIRAQKERMSEIPMNLTMKTRIKEFFKKFTRRDFIKPLIIIIFSATLLETCGRHIFPAYALQIIAAVTGNKMNSFYYTLAIDIIITTSATLSSILVKLLKRRTLLFGTAFPAIIVLFCACLYLFLVAQGVISATRTWIPIMLFVLYFILANLGCTPIPLALLGEVFPLAHRGSGSLISGFALSLLLMFALQVTPYLLVSVKVYGTFAFFGTLMAISLITLHFILPETKDKTLQEIEDYFNNGKFKDKLDDEAGMKMLHTEKENKAKV
ncbi:facilitated trehalose transporter Tret1-like isoform X1 [Colias croceus]|uniref:facilitated trehalose transporter Tret1-like isoform X1 n=4 Tax=Colias crocea TaxID=72248 RepID=UPI001E27F122|nr:facilitated trehalose transporter Tret1-like isoform X1 [Colias croceus]